jgi:predicted nuclease of predicted toxin-antitoxin system
MRFLANENLPGDAVAALIGGGHDVVWMRTAAPGSKDEEVLAWAVREGRVLLTFDQDFGELAWRAKLPSSCGIVLFRMPVPLPTQVGATMLAALDQRADWAGHFSVIQPGRVRMRPLA